MQQFLVPQATHPDMPNFGVAQNVAAMLAQGSRRVLMMIVAISVESSPRAFHRDGNGHREQFH